MEDQLSDILDNILGLLLLEGSYEVEETEEYFTVAIETKDAGRLIGARGESLDALQQLINQMMFRKAEFSAKGGLVSGQKRVILDVSSWRKQKEDELAESAESWGKQVLETGEDMELLPVPPWQRRIIHMVVGEMKGLETESVGEGRDRHIVIRSTKPVKKKLAKKVEPKSEVLPEVRSSEGDKSEEQA